MSYDYKTIKPTLFTDNGQRMFLKIRDRVHGLLKQAGAVRMTEAIAGNTGSVWDMLACVDRMVELGEIVEITPKDAVGQSRIFIER